MSESPEPQPRSYYPGGGYWSPLKMLIAAGVVAAAGVCGVAVGVNEKPSAAPLARVTPAPVSTPEATATPTPKPAPTSDQKALAIAYASEAAKTKPLEGAYTLVGTLCQAGDFVGCSGAAKQVVKEWDIFEAGLNKVAVPTCLEQVDKDLRLAISLGRQGANEEIAGIAATNADQIVHGANLTTQATAAQIKANNEIVAAACQK